MRRITIEVQLVEEKKQKDIQFEREKLKIQFVQFTERLLGRSQPRFSSFASRYRSWNLGFHVVNGVGSINQSFIERQHVLEYLLRCSDPENEQEDERGIGGTTF